MKMNNLFGKWFKDSVVQMYMHNIHISSDTLFWKAWNYYFHMTTKQSFIGWWLAHFRQYLIQFDYCLFLCVVFVRSLNVNFNYASKIHSVFPLFAFIYFLLNSQHISVRHNGPLWNCEMVENLHIFPLFYLIKFEWFSKVNTESHKIMN